MAYVSACALRQALFAEEIKVCGGLHPYRVQLQLYRSSGPQPQAPLFIPLMPLIHTSSTSIYLHRPFYFHILDPFTPSYFNCFYTLSSKFISPPFTSLFLLQQSPGLFRFRCCILLEGTELSYNPWLPPLITTFFSFSKSLIFVIFSIHATGLRPAASCACARGSYYHRRVRTDPGQL